MMVCKLRLMDEIVKRILDLADPERALEEKVSIRRGVIEVNGREFTFSRPLLISVGKASVKMANFFLKRIEPTKAIVVKPKGDEGQVQGDAEVISSGHPNPDRDSFKAGRVILNAVKSEDYDLLLFLVSGGASALMEYPLIDEEIYIRLNETLVRSGLTIQEINAVRKHVSKIKGGRLAEEAKSPVLTLIISDVPGNDLSSVGSGPTIADPTTVEDAMSVLKTLGFDLKFALPETPKNLRNSWAFKVLDNGELLSKLSSSTTNPFILTSELRGEAKDVGSIIASIYNSSTSLKRPYTLLLGGEPEVTIKGPAGKGGRNGEVCLSLLLWVSGGRFKFHAIATDGVDGNSEYAGCIVGDTTKLDKGDIRRALRDHSSYELLERIGVTVKTGPTGTNVNNVYVLTAP